MLYVANIQCYVSKQRLCPPTCSLWEAVSHFGSIILLLSLLEEREQGVVCSSQVISTCGGLEKNGMNKHHSPSLTQTLAIRLSKEIAA
jgi:hypothetical protein